jgi:cytochrome c oxidase subunit 2
MAIFDRIKTVLGAAAILAFCGAAYAKEGQPAPWQLGFQPPASPIMEQIHSFHTYVTIIITVIALRLGLLVYVMARFNEAQSRSSAPLTYRA